MHSEILTKEQIGLLELVASFSKNFGMVGGTAIALYIGHRESIDFDLFSLEEFENSKVRKKIIGRQKINEIVRDEKGQFTLIIDGVRFTFFHYPFPITFSENFENTIKLPDLITLAAMKAYALGRRAKWKDYVDLYFIIKNHHSVNDINKKAKEIFGNEFNEKLFRSQLSYFEGINYKEEVVYKKGFEVSEETVKSALVKFSLL
ncbi:MAG: hypothetical protein A3D44_04290 [Candidatus Staskawiczbacteria bacterium RIFCSPHIGHO2_02_FULL_42_22]|uniref:Nucleotidyl transferase AbiEii/AbiGii toxin family protein n=1 Tax=Candidatus Staskawiczbacteria bacterium RIFCSPHIGHO2_02_FULL_42_22 TaxID=1802207 RepID=A0A1G2I285_9BACT|nr:MAG: hypothetical protein A3D44_04290 [Candidatus Staskawiczbacteria bacterium RIFCSPHIGHO2_02_FULL_42_22]